MQIHPLVFQPLLAAVFAMGAIGQALPGWTLLWADEFTQTDGTSPDPAKWGFDTGGHGWGNNELQFHTSRTQNARVEGGQLVIEAHAENYNGKNYTSARLLTKNKWSWTYGRIEARIKIPRGQGIWPAFWMLGANVDSVSWPHCGEIDIMENIGSEPSKVHGTLHGPGYSGGGGVSGEYTLPGSALADDFHVFSIEWEENHIRWLIDNQPYFSATPAQLPNGSNWVFNNPQFLIMNLAVGGNWPGNPNASTIFPQRMTVDYVRVYTRNTVVEPPVITHVSVDTAAGWLGYMNVSNLPATGGTYQYGRSWSTPDLRAGFSGETLELKPNSIDDPSPYWYIGGGGPGNPGNKIMSANMYVEKTGTLSGRTLHFTGNVISNTLTGAHSAVAFIKDFSPDHTTSTKVTTPLAPGVFHLSLATAAGGTRHVQYGFETKGVNVWASDAGPYGSVQIVASTPNPYLEWRSKFNFSAFTNPDLTLTGDPDGDGRSNLEEFAFDGDPSRGGDFRQVSHHLGEVAGDPALLLTFPVRGTPAFNGTPAKTAVVDHVRYVIEGSNELSLFDESVSELPARTEGLPQLHDNWSYRTFRLDGPAGGPNSRGPAGYLRVRVVEAP